MSDILKEAIAEAKRVRQVAYENAKAQITEAFNPKINKALSNILKTEEEEVPVEDEENLNEEDVMDDSQSKDDKKVTVDFKENTDEMESDDEDIPVDDVPTENDVQSTDTVDDDEQDLEIESILDELENDIEDDETTSNDDNAEIQDTPVSHDEPDGDEEIDINIEDDEDDDDVELETEEEEVPVEDENDEDLNIEELLNSLDEEEYPGDDNTEDKDKEQQSVVKTLESLRKENIQLKKKINNYDKTVKYMKSQLSEVNMLNTKLLYTTKLFKNYKLTNEAKTKIVEQFDRTKSEREIKLVYTTLHESLKNKSNETKRTIKEVFNSGPSKPVRGTENKSILAEGQEFANRMKKLAGII